MSIAYCIINLGSYGRQTHGPNFRSRPNPDAWLAIIAEGQNYIKINTQTTLYYATIFTA